MISIHFVTQSEGFPSISIGIGDFVLRIAYFLCSTQWLISMRLLNPSRRVPILGTDFDTQAAGLSNLRIETYSIQASNQAATRKLSVNRTLFENEPSLSEILPYYLQLKT